MSKPIAVKCGFAQRNEEAPASGKQDNCQYRLGNCITAAMFAWLGNPMATRIRLMRNRAGRWHVFWESDGKKFEFYAPGRSRKTYLQNIIYAGRVRQF